MWSAARQRVDVVSRCDASLLPSHDDIHRRRVRRGVRELQDEFVVVDIVALVQAFDHVGVDIVQAAVGHDGVFGPGEKGVSGCAADGRLGLVVVIIIVEIRGQDRAEAQRVLGRDDRRRSLWRSP